MSGMFPHRGLRLPKRAPIGPKAPGAFADLLAQNKPIPSLEMGPFSPDPYQEDKDFC